MPIGTSYQALKDIGSLGKKIFTKKVDDEVRKQIQEIIDKSSELYDRIVFLEDERQSNRELISDLQKKLLNIKKFAREFKKYKPQKLVTGTLVYSYDSVSYKDKPPHDICTKCVRGSVISELQPSADYDGKSKNIAFTCFHCGSNFLYDKKVDWVRYITPELLSKF